MRVTKHSTLIKYLRTWPAFHYFEIETNLVGGGSIRIFLTFLLELFIRQTHTPTWDIINTFQRSWWNKHAFHCWDIIRQQTRDPRCSTSPDNPRYRLKFGNRLEKASAPVWIGLEHLEIYTNKLTTLETEHTARQGEINCNLFQISINLLACKAGFAWTEEGRVRLDQGDCQGFHEVRDWFWRRLLCVRWKLSA